MQFDLITIQSTTGEVVIEAQNRGERAASLSPSHDARVRTSDAAPVKRDCPIVQCVLQFVGRSLE